MRSNKRIFARRRGRVIWKILVVTVAVTTTMAACTSRTENWSPAQSPKVNKVNWISFSHEVRPGRAGNGLSKTERRRLDQFSADISLGYGDQVVVKTPRRHVTRAGAALVSYFRARRLDPTIRVIDRNQGQDGNTVRIIVGRYVVIPPKCPDWTKQSGPDPSNRASSNFSCATTSNLARIRM